MPQPTEPNFGVGIERVSRVPSTIEPKDSKEKDIITFLNEISTEIKSLSINLSDLSNRGKRVELLSTYISWLRHLSSLTEEILEILKNVSPEQSEIKTLNSNINKLLLFLNSMLSQSLKFQTTRDDWFRQSPKDLATANRLDPSGKCIDLEAVAELYRPKFWLDTKSQIEEIAKQLIEIIEKESNTSPEQSQVESGLSDEQLQEELEKFNQDLKKINEAADREILKGIVYHLSRKTIGYTVYFGVGGAETKRLTIMELVSNLLSEIQASEEYNEYNEYNEDNEDNEDEKILQALKIVKGKLNLYSRLRDFINHIPTGGSINPENIEKYKELFLRLSKPEGREVEIKGRKVEITLRDTSKLSYLEALLKKINEQEQEILNILNESFKERGQELNIDVFTNALRFLIKIIKTDEASKKSSAGVKKGVVSFETKEMKRRGVKNPDTISVMVVTEPQGGNRNPERCEFIPYPQYMLSLFDIGEISLVGE